MRPRGSSHKAGHFIRSFRIAGCCILPPVSQRYFLNVLAVTATLNANSIANGNTTNVGCRLNGRARYTTQVITARGRIAAIIGSEAYLDLSGLEKLLGPPEAIGREIKRRILEGTGLSASVGISPNRLIAKLGSEHRKPDGLTVVYPEQVQDFLAPMCEVILKRALIIVVRMDTLV